MMLIQPLKIFLVLNFPAFWLALLLIWFLLFILLYRGFEKLLFLEKINFSTIIFPWSGLFLGPLVMFIGFRISFILRNIYGSNISIDNMIGEFLYMMSRIRIFYWGFNQQLPMLDLQIGVASLYLGALIGLIITTYFSYGIKYHEKFLHYYTPLTILMMWVALGIGIYNFLNY